MNQFWKDMGIAFTMGFVVPAVLLAAVVSITERETEVPLLTEPIFVTESAPVERERNRMISVLDEKGMIIQLSMDDYLTCVVLAEMPASFEDEALKAQSVVARTYAMRAAEGASKHENAAVCTDSSCCQGYTDPEYYLSKGGREENIRRIRALVCSTDGQVLTYEGNLIEATYFSCSGGATEDAVAVWGTDVPYLQSVISPGEEQATHYTDTVTFTAAEFSSKLGLELSGMPSLWFTSVTYTNGGGVDTMTIGGEVFSGTQLRKMLNLRSTAFTVMTQADTITIQTRGYGHRVGMSQYGAEAMAATGSTYSEILAHYYQGTELTHCFD